MNANFLSPYEKKILSRNDSIVSEFKRLSSENSNVPAMRLIKAVAEKFDISASAVYRILIKSGIYERRSSRKSA